MAVIKGLKLGKCMHWGLSQKIFVGDLSAERNCTRKIWKLKIKKRQIIIWKTQTQQIKSGWLIDCHFSLLLHRGLQFSLLFVTLPLKIVSHGFFKIAISSIEIVMAVYLYLGVIQISSSFKSKWKFWNHWATLRNVVALILVHNFI